MPKIMPRRAKKSADPKLVKNPNYRRVYEEEDGSSDEEPPTAAQHEPDMHYDEEAALGEALEHGEIVEDAEPQGDEALPPQDLLRMVRQMKSDQGELTQRITELTQQHDKTSHDWKKEGLRKQDDMAQKVLVKLDTALANLDINHRQTALDLIVAAREILRQRTKELRIADSSDAGWETVNVYRSHPVADDSDDDRKIRKAEKLAKERLASKSKCNRSNRRGGYQRRPYNRPWGNRDDYNPQYRDQSFHGTSSGRSTC